CAIADLEHAALAIGGQAVGTRCDLTSQLNLTALQTRTSATSRMCNLKHRISLSSPSFCPHSTIPLSFYNIFCLLYIDKLVLKYLQFSAILVVCAGKRPTHTKRRPGPSDPSRLSNSRGALECTKSRAFLQTQL